MNNIDPKISKFINKHHVLTLAVSKNNVPYCANCFYAYMKDKNMLVFTSDETTRHANEAIENPNVAGSIVLETKVVGKIRGIQFNGKMYKPDEELYKKAHARYMKRFPYAMLMKTTLWVLELDFIKLTDNRLGFGKKLIWEKNA